MPPLFDHDEKKTPAPAFKVVDRRRFTASGETRAEAPERNYTARPVLTAEPKDASKTTAPTDLQNASAAPPSADDAPRQWRSSVDFLSFVASLATQAMAAMGLLPEAQSRGMPQDLGLAHEYIEIVAMLEERTENNVSADEKQALSRLLQDLRGNFVEAQRALGAPPR